jgi:VanZ family protein
MKCVSNKLPQQPGPWWLAFAMWFGTLWWLSSAHRDLPFGEEIHFIDKVYHFGYYLGGALILGGAFSRPTSAVAKPLLLTVFSIALVGALDEFHQSHVPGRSGNDPADWSADVSGGLCGAWLAQRYFKAKVESVQSRAADRIF